MFLSYFRRKSKELFSYLYKSYFSTLTKYYPRKYINVAKEKPSYTLVHVQVYMHWMNLKSNAFITFSRLKKEKNQKLKIDFLENFIQFITYHPNRFCEFKQRFVWRKPLKDWMFENYNCLYLWTKYNDSLSVMWVLWFFLKKDFFSSLQIFYMLLFE